jgi:ABC-2 type transport system permease protein
MAVYERNFRPFEGELTPERTRFLVLPRYAYQRVLASRLFVGFLVAWFLWPLALAILIYIPHNVSLLEKLGTTSEQLSFFAAFRQDADWFFYWFMIPQTWVSFVVTLIVGPALVSPDLRNNGLPLYLGRPFSRTEYILGKFSVLAILLSVVSWVPALGLFLLRAYFGGLNWLGENIRIGLALFFGCWIWILVLCVISLALSAHLKLRPVAGLALLLIFFLSSLLAGTMNLMLGTKWASLLNLTEMIYVVWASLFDIDKTVEIPAGAAWVSLLSVCSFCVWLLYRKVRAYEIVR